MRAILMFLFFTAIFLIITGIYEQKIDTLEQNKKIEYRFVPRTYLEEQLGNGGDVSDKYGTMFENASPWFDRTVGPIIDVEKPYTVNG
jgi:hypothetical protein